MPALEMAQENGSSGLEKKEGERVTKGRAVARKSRRIKQIVEVEAPGDGSLRDNCGCGAVSPWDKP